MIFDWNDFYTLAEELSRREDEAAKRTAISRLYYAIYWRREIFWKMKDLYFGKMTVRTGRFGTNIKIAAELFNQSAFSVQNFICFG